MAVASTADAALLPDSYVARRLPSGHTSPMFDLGKALLQFVGRQRVDPSAARTKDLSSVLGCP